MSSQVFQSSKADYDIKQKKLDSKKNVLVIMSTMNVMCRFLQNEQCIIFVIWLVCIYRVVLVKKEKCLHRRIHTHLFKVEKKILILINNSFNKGKFKLTPIPTAVPTCACKIESMRLGNV